MHLVQFKPACQTVPRPSHCVVCQSLSRPLPVVTSMITSGLSFTSPIVSPSVSAFRSNEVSASARVVIGAFACTWPSLSRCRAVSTYARVSAEVSSNASESTSPSVSVSVLTFASARVLASVLSSASTFTWPTVQSRVSAFGYASASLGELMGASASNWPSPSVLASVCRRFLGSDLPTVSTKV